VSFPFRSLFFSSRMGKASGSAMSPGKKKGGMYESDNSLDDEEIDTLLLKAYTGQLKDDPSPFGLKNNTTHYEPEIIDHGPLEMITKKRKRSVDVVVVPNLRHKDINCYLCGTPGHTAGNCLNALCLRCNMPGHQQRFCKHRKVTKVAPCYKCEGNHDPVTCFPFLTKEEDLFCFNCGKQGHTGMSCSEWTVVDFYKMSQVHGIPRVYSEIKKQESNDRRKSTGSIPNKKRKARRSNPPGDIAEPDALPIREEKNKLRNGKDTVEPDALLSREEKRKLKRNDPLQQEKRDKRKRKRLERKKLKKAIGGE